MTRYLQGLGYKITDRTVRYRLKRLEKSNTILGYSILLNPTLLSDKINRTILLKFKFKADTSAMISRLEKYCGEADFCVYSARMTGDFDWICHFDFHSYESNIVKVTPYTLFDDHDIRDQKWRAYKILSSLKKYQKLNEKLQFIVESL